MTSFRSSAVAVSLGIVLALATTGSSAFASSPEDWAKAYCSTGPKVSNALNDTNDSARALVDAIQAPGTDIAPILDEYDAALAKAAKLAKKAAKALKKAGAPDITNGAKVNSAGIKAYKTAAKEIGTARQALAGIDPANPTSGESLMGLGTAVGDAASALNDFSFDTLSPAVEKDQDLSRAISSAC